MIIDYISSEKLPQLICWLDWNLYAHKMSLVVCIVIMSIHYVYTYSKYQCGNFTIGGSITAIFCGFCLWCFYIAINQGYGVG